MPPLHHPYHHHTPATKGRLATTTTILSCARTGWGGNFFFEILHLHWVATSFSSSSFASKQRKTAAVAHPTRVARSRWKLSGNEIS